MNQWILRKENVYRWTIQAVGREYLATERLEQWIGEDPKTTLRPATTCMKSANRRRETLSRIFPLRHNTGEREKPMNQYEDRSIQVVEPREQETWSHIKETDIFSENTDTLQTDMLAAVILSPTFEDIAIFSGD